MAESLLDRVIRRQAWMDRPAGAIQDAVGALHGGLGRPGRRLKDLLHGTTILGHPLHPAVTDLPMGAWTAVALEAALVERAAGVRADVGDGVRSGRVEGGPATFSQPSLVVRETGTTVEVRLEAPLH